MAFTVPDDPVQQHALTAAIDRIYAQLRETADYRQYETLYREFEATREHLLGVLDRLIGTEKETDGR